MSPKFVVFDFETSLLDGTPSVSFYRPDFRVITCGFAWRSDTGEIKTKVTEGEADTFKILKKMYDSGIIGVIHNYSFEYGVLLNRFPLVQDLKCIDTMRLAQMMDNGSPMSYENSYEEEWAEAEGFKRSNGLGLEACASRFLPNEFYGHKQPYLDLIVSRGGKKGDFHLLTKEELVAYNLKDVETTLALYEVLIERLKEQGIDWSKDQELYNYRCKLVARSKTRGVLVDQDQVDRHIAIEVANIAKVEEDFYNKCKEQINEIESEKAERWVLSVKTPSLQDARRLLVQREGVPESLKFNLASGKDKARLFVDKLGIQSRFKTPTGAPSFNAKLLGQYGDAGLILSKLGTYKNAKNQTEKLKELSSFDGRWHIDLKCASTRNGRMSGGGGLNVQGMNRRNSEQQKCIKARDGNVFVFSDIGSGEPTVTAYYSRDKNYLLATFDMIGKRPYYDKDGLLIISDIYLMVASRYPEWEGEIRDVFESYWVKDGKSWKKDPSGIQGYDLWVQDSDAIAKGLLKRIRNQAKPLALGISYSMGPEKMCHVAQENGFTIAKKSAKLFREMYWDTYKYVKALEKKLQRIYREKGVIVNDFGYALHPNSEHKTLNSFIQSNVAGIMDLMALLYFEKCKDAIFVTQIHDEFVFEVPIDKLDYCKKMYFDCVKELNDLLGWSVELRFGWEESTTWSIGK